MKYLLLLSLLCPCCARAQSEADYQNTMARFVRFYNKGLKDSVCTLFPKREKTGCFWALADASREERMLERYGRIISYKYLGIDTTDEEQVRVFKVVFAKAGTKATSFTLSEDGLFGTFRLITSSEGIEYMLGTKR